MNIDDSCIEEILKRILRVTRPDKIILYGSAVKGRVEPDSDVDLLMLEPGPTNTREKSVRLREALYGMGVPFDVIVMDSGRFEESKEVIGGIAYPADKYGRIIYEAA